MDKHRITKRFEWEMGHRLLDHEGMCRHLHGHSYMLEITVEGRVDPQTGMVLDFKLISNLLKPLIEELDHAFLCDERDTDLIRLLQDQGLKHKVVRFPSTVENLCSYFAEQLQDDLFAHKHVHGFRLTIHETSSSYATLRRRQADSNRT